MSIIITYYRHIYYHILAFISITNHIIEGKCSEL